MPQLNMDGTKGILVSQYQLMYDGFVEPLKGPKPFLFSSAPSEANNKLLKSPEKAHNIIQHLAAKLLMRSEMSCGEAWTYIQDPSTVDDIAPLMVGWRAVKPKNKGKPLLTK